MIEIRVPTDADWPAIFRADGRIFGATYDDAEQSGVKSVSDLGRFRIAVDGSTIVGIGGSWPFDMTLPGGATVPTGGVTWVSVAVTHRRQGLVTRIMSELHDDIDERGEVLAALTASEGGIYERFGYGIGTRMRWSSIDRARGALRPGVAPAPGTVRLVEPLDELAAIQEVWDRFRRQRAGEVSRTEAWWKWYLADRPDQTVHVLHPDGYAAWIVSEQWNHGHPAHEMTLKVLAACTPDAHAALWAAVLSADLVGTIVTPKIALDDPLPYLLADQRALRTTNVQDQLWINVRRVADAFAARSYATDDDIVIEADGRRFKIGAAGATTVRSRPDLVTDHAALGALLLGGVAPSELAAGRRLTARTPDVLARADRLLLTYPGPHAQTGF